MSTKVCVRLSGVLVGQGYLLCSVLDGHGALPVVSHIMKASLLLQAFKADKQNSKLQKEKDSETNKLQHLKVQLVALKTQADVQ